MRPLARSITAKAPRDSSASRKNSLKEGIIEAGEKRNDSYVIQERQVPADDQDNLKTDEQGTGNVSRASWSKGKPRNDQLDEVIPSRTEFVEPMRRKMQIAAERTRDWLCLVVVVKAGKIAPAGITAQLD